MREHSTWPSVNIWIFTQRALVFSAGEEKIANRKLLLISKCLRKCWPGGSVEGAVLQPSTASSYVSRDHVKGNGRNLSCQLPNKEAVKHCPVHQARSTHQHHTLEILGSVISGLLYYICGRHADQESMTVPTEATLTTRCTAPAVFQLHGHLKQELLHTLEYQSHTVMNLEYII